MPLPDNARKRLEREKHSIEEELISNADPDVTARNLDDTLQYWVGRIKGPADTSYEKGIFFLEIQIPDDYPYAPPKMRFDTMVWHPNISSQTGAICLDILKNAWSPALTVRTALISVRALLASAEPDDPQDYEVACMYKRDRTEFEAKARQWVELYASQTTSPFETKVKLLVDMGVPASRAQETLKKHNWDVNMAADECFNC